MNGRRSYVIFGVSTAFLGATVGVERSVLSLLGEQKYGLRSHTAVLSFLVTFGLAKALSNLASGPAAAKFGPDRLLRAGWALALPVPALLAFAPSWSFVVFANALLGVNQGLCWSVAVVGMMKEAGPSRRGAAAGTNEFSGYIGLALAAAIAGWLAKEAGIERAPFVFMQGLAVVGLAVSFLPRIGLSGARGTTGVADLPPEGALAATSVRQSGRRRFARLFGKVSWTDRRLASFCLAGLMTNLTDALAWALLPLFFSQRGMPIGNIAALSSIYPAVWAVGQLGTGRISDRLGRGPVIAAGLLVQAAGIAALLPARSFGASLIAMAALGAGTALSYPTLLAAVADNSPEDERAESVGIYRLWRDLGYVVGAVLAGVIADARGASTAIWTIAGLTAAAVLPVAATLMRDNARQPVIRP